MQEDRRPPSQTVRPRLQEDRRPHDSFARSLARAYLDRARAHSRWRGGPHSLTVRPSQKDRRPSRSTVRPSQIDRRPSRPTVRPSQKDRRPKGALARPIGRPIDRASIAPARALSPRGCVAEIHPSGPRRRDGAPFAPLASRGNAARRVAQRGTLAVRRTPNARERRGRRKSLTQSHAQHCDCFWIRRSGYEPLPPRVALYERHRHWLPAIGAACQRLAQHPRHQRHRGTPPPACPGRSE